MARFATANGLRFAHRQTGPSDGPLALLLHGFPDTPATWRFLAPRLADAGYRVVTPWMRGYAPTQAPADGRYEIDDLAADANLLHEALGGDGGAVLVGHDWGALAAYAAASAAPSRWRRVVALAVPPEAAVVDVLVRPRQIRRSWYAAAAQLPWERLAPDRAMARVERLWTDWSPGYTPISDDLEPLRAAMREPGGLAAMLGYYRSNRARFLRLGAGHGTPPVPGQPVLYLHGSDDGCLGAAAARPAARVLAAANPVSAVEVRPGVGHFLHLEDPDGVGGRIAAWVAT